ncbi:hypothetical protein PYV50_14945 [Pseudomonas sp. H22_DOA]|nr:hypothetical protein PYV50_14945 [Pseudomonas sp. H22_DOA]
MRRLGGCTHDELIRAYIDNLALSPGCATPWNACGSSGNWIN